MLIYKNLIYYCSYIKEVWGYILESIVIIWVFYFYDYGFVDGLI